MCAGKRLRPDQTFGCDKVRILGDRSCQFAVIWGPEVSNFSLMYTERLWTVAAAVLFPRKVAQIGAHKIDLLTTELGIIEPR